jgi:peptidoglycan/LPS O-acetylase OafA/YrhL
MPASPRSVASTIPGLTSLRFFAAFAVVLYHTLPPWTYPGWTFVWQVTRNGATGVSLFFVLSGFILFHVYKEAIASGRFSTWDFLSARFARIYPVYVIGLVLALPGFGLGAWNTFHFSTDYQQAAIAAPLLIQAWIPNTACHWNCPGWSVSVEGFFYLLFPIIAFLALRTDRKAIPAILVLTYALMLVAPMLFVTAGLPTNETNLNLNPDLMALRFNPMVRLPEFVFGVLVGRFTESMPARIPRWACGIVAAAIVATLYGTYYLPPTVTETFVENGLYAPLFTLLIVTIAKGSGALLAGTTWVRLGNASYALYIIHMPLWGIFRFATSLQLIPSAEHNLTIYCCYMAVTLCGAQLIHAYIEEPLRRALRKRLHGITLRVPANGDGIASERAAGDVPNSGFPVPSGSPGLPAQALRAVGFAAPQHAKQKLGALAGASEGSASALPPTVSAR